MPALGSSVADAIV